MKIINKLSTIVILAILYTSLANAQWIYQEQESAFDDEKLHLVITGSGNYGFGFRCKDKTSLEVVYITPEKADKSSIDTLNSVAPQLLIKVDNNDANELDGKLAESDLKLGMFSSVPVELFEQLVNASNKVSVAIKILSDVIHEKEFNVINSTKSGRKLIEECGL